MTLNKDIAFTTLQRWIQSCFITEQLDVCICAVQDVMYTRLNDEKLATDLKYLIMKKREELEVRTQDFPDIIGYPVNLD
jgi:hypothetical protein